MFQILFWAISKFTFIIERHCCIYFTLGVECGAPSVKDGKIPTNKAKSKVWHTENAEF